VKRVLVIGCPGSGKTRLAGELARRTGLPLVHLDKLFWLPGWVEPERPAWLAKLAVALAEPEWVMDGNYTNTHAMRLQAADTAIVLEPPRWLCLWRILRRVISGFGRTREDMADGCPERFDLGFLLYVWTFQRKQTPRLEAALREFDGQVIRLRTPREVQSFLDRT